MSLKIPLKTTLVMTSKIYVGDDSKIERVIEVRILDLRKRKGVKQKSFSISVPVGTKDNEYPSSEELKKELQKAIKEMK